MINAKMRSYNYYTLGEANAYGQPTLPTKDSTPVGTIKIAISTTSQAVQDNVNYKDCSYIGLTQAKVNDTYVIEYEEELLKVLYINTDGRYTQVFLQAI
jgi:hypothetical protein